MAIFASSNTVTDGLVLCLDAANRESYPGTGTTWFDISGNNFHASLYNTPLFTGRSFYFDGIDMYGEIDAGIKDVIESATDFTLITFSNVKLIEHVDNLVGWGNANTSNGYSRTFGQYARSTTLETSYQGALIGNSAGVNILNKWLLLVSRYDDLEFYGDVYGSVRNSSYKDQNATSFTWKEIPIAYPVTIAKTSYYAKWMEVDISLILMYNRFLSNEEILKVFDSMRTRKKF